MRILVIFCLLVSGYLSDGQDFKQDFKLIKKEAVQERQEVEKNGFFKGILKLYSNHISDQIINDCIYEQSCSAFSQGALRAYGPVKGTFLTMDRMMRCNRMSQSYAYPVRFNKLGKISDHWYRYGKED